MTGRITPSARFDLTRDGVPSSPRALAPSRLEHRSDHCNLLRTSRTRDTFFDPIAQILGHRMSSPPLLASSMNPIFAEDAQYLATDLTFFMMSWHLGIRKTKEILYENRFLAGTEAKEPGYVQRTGVLEYPNRVCEQEPFKLRITKMSNSQIQDIHSFTPHMLTHRSAWVVSRAATQKVDTQEQTRASLASTRSWSEPSRSHTEIWSGRPQRPTDGGREP